MQENNTTVEFGPVAGDQATLSKSDRATLEALYRHPLSHNLEWRDVVTLFESLGTVDGKPQGETTFTISGEHHRMRKPHGKDLAADDVMAFRQILTRAGWSPSPAAEPDGAGGAGRTASAAPNRPDLLAVVDHHEARLYHLDVRSADVAGHVIRPSDPHHFLHHLSHKDQSREQGPRTPEDRRFYEQIAQSLATGGRIVLIGHGKGHSNAARHLADYLAEHHAETFRRVVCESVADLSRVTAAQLLDTGRRALTV